MIPEDWGLVHKNPPVLLALVCDSQPGIRAIGKSQPEQHHEGDNHVAGIQEFRFQGQCL